MSRMRDSERPFTVSSRLARYEAKGPSTPHDGSNIQPISAEQDQRLRGEHVGTYRHEITVDDVA